MFEEFGNLGLTRDQFRELLLTYVVGMHIRRRTGVLKDQDLSLLEDLERHLLSFAAGFEADDLVERVDQSLYPSRELDELCHEILEGRDNEEFWDRLEDELAWRDYVETLPPLKRLLAEQSEEDPPDEFYAKYEREFKTNGADRLFIDEQKPGREST